MPVPTTSGDTASVRDTASVAVGVLAALSLVLALHVPDAGTGHVPDAGRAGTDGGERVRMDRAWPVMGTLLQLTALAPDSAAAERALRAGKAEVFGVDSLMSTYRPGSELSRLNAAAGEGRWIRLSPRTAEVLDAALRWAEVTGGAFDPTVGPLARAWGFHQDSPRVPPPAIRDSAARLVGWDRVRWRPDRRRARLPRDGMRLDFGAIAKGYALDRAVKAMRRAGADGGMADLGGNVSVFGAPPGGRRRWRLGIRHPRRDGRILGTVALDSGSVATSGDAVQFFERDGVRYSHIMDPRTGRPARGVAQVTVVAPTGMAADALATALFVLGPGEGRALLESRELPGRGERASVLWVRDPGAGTPVARRHLACVPGRLARFHIPLSGGERRKPFRCGAGQAGAPAPE